MHDDFDLPTRHKITARKSTLTALFLTSITPCIAPSDDEVREALAILGMTEGACVCAYCGDRRTEWDHFRPIVKDRRPTGFITEIANLVPACGKCNQSKGNKDWREWMTGTARHAPGNRKIADLSARMERLASYEKWRTPTKIDYEATLGTPVWQKHMAHLEEVLTLLASAERHADECREIIASATRSTIAVPPSTIPIPSPRAEIDPKSSLDEMVSDAESNRIAMTSLGSP